MIYWLYNFTKKIKEKNQLDLGQGNTPLIEIPSINKKLKIPHLFFKREDLNPNASFKDRALAYQISLAKQNNEKYVVLSSSGNAAISCASFCQKTKIKPIILVSPSIPKNKLSQIIDRKPFLLIQSKNARRFAKYIHKKYNIPLLNPSTDENAATGFETLGEEILLQNPECETIFTYSTSGASITGIIDFYLKNNLIPPQIVAIQIFDQKIKANQINMLPKFYQHNSKKIIEYMKKVRGLFHRIRQDQAIIDQKILHHNNIPTSIEGAAAFSAVKEYLESKKELEPDSSRPDNIVCIISGKEHEILPISPDYKIFQANSRNNIDQIMSKLKK